MSGPDVPALELRGVTRGYGGPAGRVVLQGLDLHLARGAFVAVMGESGSGKSTLLNLAAGLETPDAGSVQLCGTPLAGLGETDLARLRARQVGFVFQAFHLLPYLDVADNVALPLRLAGLPPDPDRVAALLQAVGLGGRESARPAMLSGGEQQRVAVARALVHRPALLLADEPTGNLDAGNAVQVLELLRTCLQEAGAAGILVTHSRRAAGRADHILELCDGRLRPLPGPAC